MQGKRILGFRKRNLAEGAIMALVAAYIISLPPFVKTVQVIITFCVAAFLVIINGIGIKGRSYSQTLINYIAYKKHLKQLSYRRINDNPDDIEPLFEEKNGKTRVNTIHEKTAVGKAQRFFHL